MPKLRGYSADLQEAPISGGRRATADDFGGGIGEATTGLAHRVQKVGESVVEMAEQKDERYVIVEQARLRQQTAKALEQATLSGAPTEPIREKLENDLAGLKNKVTTKKGLTAADYHGFNTMNVYDTAENQLRVQRAATEARTQATTLMAEQGATLASRPAYLPAAIQISDQFLDTFKGRVAPEKLEDMKQAQRLQLNESAVRAWSLLDPAATKAQLEAGEFTLTPAQRRQEIGFAEGQIRQRRQDAEHEMRMDEYRKQKLSDESRGEWNQEIFGGTAKTTQILADRRLTAAHQEHLILLNDRWIDQLRNGDKKPNPVLERDLMLRIYAPEGSPEKIYSADAVYEAMKRPDGLNVTQFRRLYAEVANAKDPNNSTVNQRFFESMQMVNAAVQKDAGLLMQPWLMAELSGKWAGAVRALMDQERAEGRNPARLFNPQDKDWVMRREFIQQFFISARQTAAGSASTLAGGAAVGADVKTFPDGVTRKYKGSGDPMNWKDNWVEVKPSTAAAQVAAVPKSFNGVNVPPVAHRNEGLTARVSRAYPKQRGESSAAYTTRMDMLTARAREAGAE